MSRKLFVSPFLREGTDWSILACRLLAFVRERQMPFSCSFLFFSHWLMAFLFFFSLLLVRISFLSFLWIIFGCNFLYWLEILSFSFSNYFFWIFYFKNLKRHPGQAPPWGSQVCLRGCWEPLWRPLWRKEEPSGWFVPCPSWHHVHWAFHWGLILNPCLIRDLLHTSPHPNFTFAGDPKSSRWKEIPDDQRDWHCQLRLAGSKQRPLERANGQGRGQSELHFHAGDWYDPLSLI